MLDLEKLSSIKQFFIDIQGTIISDKEGTPIPGAIEFINNLAKNNIPFRLVTNNTTEIPAVLFKRLQKMGFDIDIKHYIDTLTVTVSFLNKKNINTVYVIGSEKLISFLNENNIECVKNLEKLAQAVVVGLDTKLTYTKLKFATEHLLRGSILIAMHLSPIYKTSDGIRAPGVGSITKALEYASQIKAINMGKPSEYFWQEALSNMPYSPKETLLISDDPVGDLIGGKRFGFLTAFVLSGKYHTPLEIVPKIKKEDRPDFVIDSLKILLSYL